VVRNSLFQRDKPHLVHHMMMDSDVQDIFDEHQKSIEMQEQSGSTTGGGDGASRSLQSPAAVQQSARTDQSQTPEGESKPEAQPQYAFHQVSESAPKQVQTAPAAAPRPTYSDPSLEALQAILDHSQKFLDFTSVDDAQVAAMRTMLQMLIVMGKKHLEVKQEEEQQRQRLLENTTQVLLQQLAHLFGHQQLVQLLGQQQLPTQSQGNQPQTLAAFAPQPQITQQQPQGFQAAQASVVQNPFQMFGQQQAMTQTMAAAAASPLQSVVSQQLMQQSGQTHQQLQPDQTAAANAVAQMLQALMQPQQKQGQQYQQQPQQQGQQYQQQPQQQQPQHQQQQGQQYQQQPQRQQQQQQQQQAQPPYGQQHHQGPPSPGVNNGCSQS
jgi:hypothetical protein